jgi:hypothetical protein
VDKENCGHSCVISDLMIAAVSSSDRVVKSSTVIVSDRGGIRQILLQISLNLPPLSTPMVSVALEASGLTISDKSSFGAPRSTFVMLCKIAGETPTSVVRDMAVALFAARMSGCRQRCAKATAGSKRVS